MTSLRLDSLIPPPHNHVAALVEVGAGAFQKLRKLDIAVTAWDQVRGRTPGEGTGYCAMREGRASFDAKLRKPD